MYQNAKMNAWDMCQQSAENASSAEKKKQEAGESGCYRDWETDRKSVV